MRFRLSDTKSHLVIYPETQAEEYQLENVYKILKENNNRIVHIDNKQWNIESVGIELIKDE